MSRDEIDAIRALLGSKPRPIGWSERRQRLDEVGSVWPVADDVSFEAVNCDGVPGEWSLASGSDASRVLIFFHGGGYCSGSILSHRRMVSRRAIGQLGGVTGRRRAAGVNRLKRSQAGKRRIWARSLVTVQRDQYPPVTFLL